MNANEVGMSITAMKFKNQQNSKFYLNQNKLKD